MPAAALLWAVQQRGRGPPPAPADRLPAHCPAASECPEALIANHLCSPAMQAALACAGALAKSG